jgi:hypothetical protein
VTVQTDADFDAEETGGATYHGSARRRDLATTAGWARRDGTTRRGITRPGGNTRPAGRK